MLPNNLAPENITPSTLLTSNLTLLHEKSKEPIYLNLDTFTYNYSEGERDSIASYAQSDSSYISRPNIVNQRVLEEIISGQDRRELFNNTRNRPYCVHVRSRYNVLKDFQ